MGQSYYLPPPHPLQLQGLNAHPWPWHRPSLPAPRFPPGQAVSLLAPPWGVSVHWARGGEGRQRAEIEEEDFLLGGQTSDDIWEKARALRGLTTAQCPVPMDCDPPSPVFQLAPWTPAVREQSYTEPRGETEEGGDGPCPLELTV